MTGAGAGIGRAVAKALVNAGATTYALGRTLTSLQSLQEEVPEIEIIHVDLQDWDETRHKVEALEYIDLLVNNAAVYFPAPFLETTRDNFQDTMDVNVKSVVNVSQIIGKGMVKRGKGGSIVNISSQVSLAAMAGFASYCTSKAALDSLSRVMAVELGPWQVRVNSVNPTVVLTEKMKNIMLNSKYADRILDRIPQGKFAHVKDVVYPVLYLLSDKADMISGITLPVDGGFLAC